MFSFGEWVWDCIGNYKRSLCLKQIKTDNFFYYGIPFSPQKFNNTCKYTWQICFPAFVHIWPARMGLFAAATRQCILIPSKAIQRLLVIVSQARNKTLAASMHRVWFESTGQSRVSWNFVSTVFLDNIRYYRCSWSRLIIHLAICTWNQINYCKHFQEHLLQLVCRDKWEKVFLW